MDLYKKIYNDLGGNVKCKPSVKKTESQTARLYELWSEKLSYINYISVSDRNKAVFYNRISLYTSSDSSEFYQEISVSASQRYAFDKLKTMEEKREFIAKAFSL